MANNPKRMQDPTEAAMSAIQEALNLREDPPATSRASELAPPTAPAADPFANMTAEVAAERPARRRPSRSAPPIDEDLFLQETVGRAPAPASVEEVKPVQRAANDDRQSVGQVLQSMQRRPSRAPYMAAFFLSAVWVVLGIVVGASYFGTDLRAIASQGVHPTLFALAAGIALPVLLFYVLAHMVRRAQELRIIARSIARPQEPRLTSAARQTRANAARAETEAAFLDAAERLLIEVGYAGITTRRLAEEAGANAGLVHYYFGSMEEVFVRALERFTGRLIARQREMYAADVPFIDKWRTAMQYLDQDLAAGYPKVWHELQALGWNRPEIRERVASVNGEWRVVLREAFGRALDEYGLDPDRYPLEAIVSLVMTFNVGIELERLSGIHDGHRELLAWVDSWLEKLEDAKEDKDVRRRAH